MPLFMTLLILMTIMKSVMKELLRIILDVKLHVLSFTLITHVLFQELHVHQFVETGSMIQT